ncbi:AmmeMemoRadiSam system radical SAM enzyme [bacterium]|nr:AmmeMemoRadiSam system radical SAM enzyme [bacterium]
MISEHPEFSRSLDDGRLQCTLCPRDCKLSDAQRGLCFVRQRQGNRIALTTYGRSSGFVIDPIEKKPLNHFLPGTPVLSFGTAGCNLSCKFCQNWDISKSREMDTLQSSATPDAIVQAALEHGCRSVAFTYNDPVIFYEYAVDTAIACHKNGLKTVAVTAGYISEQARPRFFEHMDAANVDLKGFSESFYHDLCAGSLSHVLETLLYLVHESQVWIEITTLLIPDENDSPEELEAMTKWIANNLGKHIPLHFTAFHPDYKFTNRSATPHQTLMIARKIALNNGLKHVYLGNVHDIDNAATYCHNCGIVLITRMGYQLGEWHLDEQGACEKCGSPIPGVFEAQAGNWGNRFQRIRF